jgi:GAF domain-containing protein
MNDFPAEGGTRRNTADLYARSAAIHESSARVLRGNGRHSAADAADRSAASARDGADGVIAAARSSAAGQGLFEYSRLSALFDEALDGAIAFLGADFGYLELAGVRTRELWIVSQRGFDREFLDYVAVVEGERAASARTATAGVQAMIADVDLDPAFAAHREMAAASGFRAVLSTPLIDRKGLLRGVLSTHFRNPHRPAEDELRTTLSYGRVVADAIARNFDTAA